MGLNGGERESESWGLVQRGCPGTMRQRGSEVATPEGPAKPVRPSVEANRETKLAGSRENRPALLPPIPRS
jgi:hypothetical protein